MSGLLKYTMLSLLLPLFPGLLMSQDDAAPTVARDAQAVAVVAQAVQAMGGAAPSDLTASGKIELGEGSKTESSEDGNSLQLTGGVSSLPVSGFVSRGHTQVLLTVPYAGYFVNFTRYVCPD